MRAFGAVVFPAYAPAVARWKSAPVLIAVLALHAAIAAVVETAAQPARPLAAPVGPTAPIMLLMLSEGKAGSARVTDRLPPPMALPEPLLAVRASANPFDEEAQATPVDQRYLPAGKLDIGPLPAGAPDFASVTQRTLAIGKVTMRVYVSAFGLPDRVEILGLPMDADFAQALRRALEQTTFLPGRLGGHDVAAYVDYEFQTEVVVLPAPPNLRSS
jgi:hypothetical protein